MASLQNLLSPVKGLVDTFERMSQRERTMVALLGATFVLCALFIGGFVIASSLSDLEEKNAAMRQALRDIESKRGAYLQARAKIAALESRIGVVPLQLAGFLDQAGKETGVNIRETDSRPPEPIGKKYIQQSMDVRISKVGLEPLMKFMRKLERHPSNLVLVTQLFIRSRDDKRVDFEVDMTVSTYERAPKPGTDKKGAAGPAAAEPDKEPP
jgi:hypothetical protein